LLDRFQSWPEAPVHAINAAKSAALQAASMVSRRLLHIVPLDAEVVVPEFIDDDASCLVDAIPQPHLIPDPQKFPPFIGQWCAPRKGYPFIERGKLRELLSHFS
jgi:hypothetical protein